MKSHPIFVQGDEITFSTMTLRISRIPSYRRVEDHYTDHGFFIGNVDRDYSVIRRFLLDLNVEEVDQNPASGVIIGIGGTVYQVYYSPGTAGTKEEHVAGVIQVGSNPQEIYVMTRCLEENQCIALAKKMGYNTIPAILNMLGRVTTLNVDHYVTMKISDITKEFKKRGTLPYYGYYLRNKESINKELDRREAEASQ